MNGNEPKIEFIRPFEEAFEVMKKILFQPFDLGKWCVIGFAAWLAQLGSGGGFNFRYNRGSDWRQNPEMQRFFDTIHQIPSGILIGAGSLLVILIVALIVVFTWLRARGRFMFTDCVVKNRAAIAEPWREFREQGNSYFLFSLLVGCCLTFLTLALSIPWLLPIFHGITHTRLHKFYFLSMLLLWGVILLFLIFAWALLSHIMVVVMYRRRCRALEGLSAAIALINQYPGEITLYCLFWIALAIGTVFAACILVCATCCIAAIPYIGTVILLPIYVLLHAFVLLFFRQFGPDYDVWAGGPLPNQLPPTQVPPPLPT